MTSLPQGWHQLTPLEVAVYQIVSEHDKKTDYQIRCQKTCDWLIRRALNEQ